MAGVDSVSKLKRTMRECATSLVGHDLSELFDVTYVNEAGEDVPLGPAGARRSDFPRHSIGVRPASAGGNLICRSA